MPRPESLHGTCLARSYLCAEWELRITERCVTDDLARPAASGFAELLKNIEIVEAFVKDRSPRSIDTRKIEPLTCGRDVWVLSRGNDHRGGTWHDEDEEVIWLLASGVHRSGQDDDFFPYCKQLDADDELLPTAADYSTLFRERDRWFVEALVIEAPLILQEARLSPGHEIRHLLGGDFASCISVEIDQELEAEALYVAFDTRTVDFGRVPVVLAAFHPDTADWGQTRELPSRAAAANEIVMTCTRVAPSGA